MQYELTPATERAIRIASGWTDHAGALSIGAPAVLLGLLAEQECRAAIILSRAGVCANTVRERWPHLEPSVPERSAEAIQALSADVRNSLQIALEHLAEFPQPLALATEHVLLGLAASSHEVGSWLREQGVQPDRLEKEVHEIYGHEFGPLPCESDDGLDSEMRAEGENRRALQKDHGVGPAEAPQCAMHPKAEASGCVTPPVLALRVLDAAANRAREAFRVIEDYTRFVLDDRFLSSECKTLRHEMVSRLKTIPSRQRIASRETQEDVGTQLTTSHEQLREDLTSVLAAGFARLQESLRSLEEFGKLVGPRFAAQMKQLRYRSYTLQRAVEITRNSGGRLKNTRLYVLVDGHTDHFRFQQMVEGLVAVGVHALQLRDKRLSDRELVSRGRMLRKLTADSSTLFIMNDRPDLAVLTRADGVHVGQDDLSAKDIRQIVGPEMLLGISTHSLKQAQQAVLDGADYIGVGPMFSSATKQFDLVPGVSLLQEVCAELHLPAFAIGGITCDNLDRVLAANCRRIAVSGAVAGASDPAAAAQALLLKLNSRDEPRRGALQTPQITP